METARDVFGNYKNCLSQKAHNIPNEPQNLAELVIPIERQRLKDGREFLLQDTGGANRILIFSTAELLQALQQYDKWGGDGTFGSIPNIFYNRGSGQLYTIHAKIGVSYVPAVFILMPRRDRPTYLHASGFFKYAFKYFHVILFFRNVARDCGKDEHCSEPY